MIPNRLGLAARSFVVIVAAAAWVPPSAAAGALPVQNDTFGTAECDGDRRRPFHRRNRLGQAVFGLGGSPITRIPGWSCRQTAGSTWSLSREHVAASQLPPIRHSGPLRQGATRRFTR